MWFRDARTGAVQIFSSIVLAATAGVLIAPPAVAQSELDVVIVIDESADTRGLNDAARSAVAALTDTMIQTGADWRFGLGAFGADPASGLGNPRVLQPFTADTAAINASASGLVSSSGAAWGLQAVVDATELVDTFYGAPRRTAGYCVVLISDADSDYSRTAQSLRSKARAGLELLGASFVAVVNDDNPYAADRANIDEDYNDLIGDGVPGATISLQRLIASPEDVANEIVSACSRTGVQTRMALPEFTMDLLPRRCDNRSNLAQNGETYINIMGIGPGTVNRINPDSLALEGCPVVRYYFEDLMTYAVPTTGANGELCYERASDGRLDLTARFLQSCLATRYTLTERENLVEMELTGMTWDGEPLVLSDKIILIGPEPREPANCPDTAKSVPICENPN